MQESMKIKILGCSGGIGPGRRTTSLLIDDHILLDAGTGVGDLPFARMTRITDVLLTHSHLDHVCGLALLVDVLFDRIDRPLRVHASAETIAVLREDLFNWRLWPDFTQLPSADAPRLAYATVMPRRPYVFGRVRATPFEVLHTVPAVGYSLEAGGAVFAFTGDTYADERLWNYLNALPRLDHLMIDVSFVDAEAEISRVSRHFTPALLGQELNNLRHRPQLLLTHHKPGSERAIAAECTNALRGWSYRHLKRGDVIEL
jgi:ribonuclease BN (tRNA processing enzyme)